MSPAPVAAIDIGTNSTRLLVQHGGEVLERSMRITRLGAGVDRSRVLDPEAVERTLRVLREYRGLLDRHEVVRFRAVATSAVRDAANREEFLAAAADALGAPPDVLDGDEEGRLSFSGATAGLEPDEGPYLLVDVGGGSTEFVVGSTGPVPPEAEAEAGAEAVAAMSVDTGSVRLTEQYLRADPPSAEELSQAISVVHSHLDDVKRELPAVREARRLVGVAGTVTTMAAVEIGLATYDRDRIHHFVLTRAAAEDVFRTLATERLADRVHNPGLERERADIIVGGAAIVVTVMRHFDFDTLLVSETDILDGLVSSLAAAPPASGAVGSGARPPRRA